MGGKIVSRFGGDTFNILDNEPDKLLEIPRFGQKRLTAVKISWAEHQGGSGIDGFFCRSTVSERLLRLGFISTMKSMLSIL